MNNIILNSYKDIKKKFGKKVKITRADFSTSETIGIIKEYNNGNSSSDDKKILFDVKDNVEQGDFIEYNNNIYLIVLQEENINDIYTRYVARRCDGKIKIKFADGIYNLISIIEDKIQNTADGKILNIVDGKIEILTQLNSITKKIRYNWKFITMGNKWKVEGFSYNNKGLYKIYCNKEATGAEDNLETEECLNEEGKNFYINKITEKDIYTIDIIKDDIKDIGIGEKLQLNIICRKNNIEDKTPTLTYKSNNSNITIDNKGIITAIKEGNSTITVIYNNVETSININVIKSIPIPIEKFILDGSDKLYIKKAPQEYKVLHENNSEVTDKTFTFTLERSEKTVDQITDITVLATIKSSTSTSCILEANPRRPGWIKLKAVCNEDNSIVLEKEIYVRFLM